MRIKIASLTSEYFINFLINLRAFKKKKNLRSKPSKYFVKENSTSTISNALHNHLNTIPRLCSMKLHTNINLLLPVKSFNKGIVANHKERKKKKGKTTLQKRCCDEREKGKERTYRPQRGETRLSFTVNHGTTLFIVFSAPPR